MLKKKHKFIFAVVVVFLGWQVGRFFVDEKVSASQDGNFISDECRISISDDGLNFSVSSKAKNVTEFIDEQKIALSEYDLIYPNKEEKIYAGSRIIIQRAKKITVKENGNNKQFHTFQNTVEAAIWGSGEIILGEDDVTVPSRNTPVVSGMKISVTHVLIKEEIKKVDIDFKTISNEDDELGWRVKKVAQKGEVGTKEVTYKVVFNDGKEISRKVLESKVTKDPIEEIVTQGTLVKVGKVHTGAASWYAWTGTMAAANPWLPMGSYVRVINQDNGKSVIVKINDRGPFGNGRIIDLDKVAFAQIASVGAGVVNVKMEVITN